MLPSPQKYKAHIENATITPEINGCHLMELMLDRYWSWNNALNSSYCVCVCLLLSRVQLLAPPWTAAHQAPLSMESSRQEYWSGEPFPSPGDFPDPGIEPKSSALQTDSLQAVWVTKETHLLVGETAKSHCQVHYSCTSWIMNGMVQNWGYFYRQTFDSCCRIFDVTLF